MLGYIGPERLYWDCFGSIIQEKCVLLLVIQRVYSVEGERNWDWVGCLKSGIGPCLVTTNKYGLENLPDFSINSKN